MKKEDVYNAITDIDGELIEEAGAMKRARILKTIKYVGNAAAVIVICVIVLGRSNFGKMGANMEMAKSDSVASTEAVAESVEESKLVMSAGSSEEGEAGSSANGLELDEINYAPDYDSSLNGFTGRLIKNFFAEKSDDNRIISPSNVYLALAMLAETTDSSSRTELLNALGVSDIDTLRTQALATWSFNHLDDGIATSLIGSSLWLDGKYNYKEETLKNLADYYQASVNSGKMGSEELNKQLREWMNDQTGYFLKDQIEGIGLTKDMIAAIISTIYFKDSWIDSFSKNANTQMTFHGTKGDKEVTFMNKGKTAMFYSGKNYTATDWTMNDGYTMTFIKSTGKKNAQEMLADDEVLKFILSEDTAKKSRSPIVELSVPKFDAQSQVELKDVLKSMGVKDVFTGNADFTPLTEDTNDIEVSSVLHGARVKIDEEGCEAAAYTVISMGVTAAPVRDVEEFVLDEPFIYVIRNNMGAPLFVGIINNVD